MISMSSIPLPPIDLAEFEPRPSTPIRSRLSPDKRPISSANGSPRNTPFTPVRKPQLGSSTLTLTPTRKSLLEPVLLSSDRLRPKAKLTAEAIPRKKQILPGAPNPVTTTPISIFPRASHSSNHKTWTPSSSPSQRHTNIYADYYNEDEDDVEEMEKVDENVLVAVRLRPGNGPSIWEVDSPNAKIWESATGSPGPDSCFDAVFGSDCSNEQVYKSSAAHELIASSMKGYDSTIFAYGQTASGKTFTLTGNRDQPGIIPLAVTDIFKFIRDHPTRDFLLRASYVEIYNEQINDLLLPPTTPTLKPTIKIRQDPITKHFYPTPIREEVVTNETQVSELLNRGEKHRHVSGTDWNSRSSRSHTVFSIVIESRKSFKVDGIVRRSRVCLIDLAGSERATSDGNRRAEGAFINKSLLTLEKVIGALSKPGLKNNPTQHVPFRDSKLTQILQPSLSGDAKVCVICTMNPSSIGNAVEESRGTLRFARRVKRVAVKAGVKEILSERALITRYRQQIVELQCQLNQAVSGAKPQTSTPSTTTEESKAQQMVDAEVERDELLSRLNKLQSIVLNAANLDKDHETVARPVSPTKLGNRTIEEDELDEEDLRALTISQAETIEKLKTELEVFKSLKTCSSSSDLIELAELKVIVSNIEPEKIEMKYNRRLKILEDENRRRKAFGEEMVNLLEAAQTKAKQLELFIINELKRSVVKTRQRPRRSSMGTYIPSVQPGQEGDRLLALVNERPEIRCIRASFGNVEIDLEDQ